MSKGKYQRMRAIPLFAVILAISSFIVRSEPASGTPEKVVSFVYPAFCRRSFIQGEVELAVSISEDGVVQKVTRKSGHLVLAEPATRALYKWRFSPCSSQSGCEALMHFKFVLEGGSCASESNCPSEFTVELPDHIVVTATPPRAIVD